MNDVETMTTGLARRMAKEQDHTPLFAAERRDQILHMLEEKSKILVPELCEHFNVSPATIRGDLRDLESEGKIKRTHGGAIPVGKAGFEPASKTKEVEHSDEKRRIAAQAAKLIDDGDTIVLDTGTTTLELAKHLGDKKNLTVVTTDIEIARILENTSDVNIVLIGGIVRRGFHCTTGTMAVAALSSLNVDMAFMAANAFSLEKGFTTPAFEHVEIKKTMISIASETVMLMDSSKIGRISFIKFADLDEIDRLVIDDGIGKKAMQTLKDSNDGLEVIIV
ncbi:MAG: DeoR/GlpR family DNA-binding transcription regulator [Planctomycetes bacterium]|nr:DeoR/GlpR family DNA-binding transcription regulator [Planctomycetota bacterium]